jgi:hypothetical protein
LVDERLRDLLNELFHARLPVSTLQQFQLLACLSKLLTVGESWAPRATQ